MRTIWIFLLAGSSRSHRTFYNEEIAESHYFTVFSRSLGSDEAGAGYQIFAQNPAEYQQPRQSYSFTLLFEFFWWNSFIFWVFSHNLKSKNNGIMLFCRAVVSNFLKGIFSSEGVLKGESENDLDALVRWSGKALKCKISPECWQGCRDQCQKWHFYNDFWMLLFEGK